MKGLIVIYGNCGDLERITTSIKSKLRISKLSDSDEVECCGIGVSLPSQDIERLIEIYKMEKLENVFNGFQGHLHLFKSDLGWNMTSNQLRDLAALGLGLSHS
jgi:hypothetical protein